MPNNSPSGVVNLNVQRTIEYFIRPTFTDHELGQSFRLIRNLYAGKMKLSILSQLKNIVHKAQHCAPVKNGEFKLSEREIFANYCEAGVQWCYEELVNSQYDQLAPLYTTQNGQPNLNELIGILLTQFRQGLKLDIERVAWFGDSSLDDGNLDWADGVWTRIKELNATNELGQYIDSTGTLTDLQAYELLQNVVRGSQTNKVLRSFRPSEQVIHISGDLWYKITDYLADSAISNGFIKVFEEVQGLQVGTYRGIPVMVHHNWDVVNSEYFGLTEQNLILHTVKDNLVLATDVRENALGGNSTSKIYQDPRTDAIEISTKFVFDTNIVFPNLCSVAYPA